MAVGDLWEVRDIQEFLGQQVINVYHYVQLTDPDIGSEAAIAAELNTQFYANVASMVTAIQDVALTHVRLESAQFGSFTAFDVVSNGDNGQVSGDALPSFAAWAFRLNRESRVVRNGSKRVGGVPESYQVNGLATSAAITAMGPYITGLTAILSFDSIPVWQPVILRVPPDGSLPTVWSAIADVGFGTVTSQNSRKIGRGA